VKSSKKRKRHMMYGKRFLLVASFIVGSPSQVMTSVYSMPRDYSGNYLPSIRSNIVLTADSPSVNQIIHANQTPGTWALNLRKGTAGIINQAFGTTSDAVNAGIVQSNGTFIGVGSTSDVGGSGLIVRVLSNGALDTSFAGTGYLIIRPVYFGDETASFTSVAFDLSGQGYYVGATLGTPAGAIGHILNNGTADTTFNMTGIFSAGVAFTSVVGVGVQSSGNIVYAGLGAGATFSVGRVTPAGITDPTFTQLSSNATITIPCAMALDSQGRIIVVGSNGTPKIVVARLNANGGLDTNFNGTGFYTTAANANAYGVTVLPDDSILVVGDNAGTGAGKLFEIVKLTSAGILDSSFGAGTGIVIPSLGADTQDSSAKAVTLVPGGQIAVVGTTTTGPNTYMATTLLNSNGTLNAQFTISGQAVPSPAGTALIKIAGDSTGNAIGYQNSVDSGLVLGGTAFGFQNVGVAFYTNVGVTQ
jgi:uncharacterized delta-60 repeat protein